MIFLLLFHQIAMVLVSLMIHESLFWSNFFQKKHFVTLEILSFSLRTLRLCVR